MSAPRRDLEKERHYFETAASGAGASSFADLARARLEVGERLYGDRWATLGIDRLLVELAEEALDLGAWGALALQALPFEPLIHSTTQLLIARSIHEAIDAGAIAHVAIVRALANLGEDLR